MIIGIDAHHANKPIKTGTEWYAFDLLRNLPLVDPQQTFRFYTPTPLDPALLKERNNIENAVLTWPPRRLWTQLRLSLEMLFRQPDVLFVPAHAIPLIHPRRTVTTIHDVGFLRSPELYSRFELAYNKVTTSFALRTAHRIIVPSAFTKQEILGLYPWVRPDKLVVIHHGFSRERFTPHVLPEKIAEVMKRYAITKPYLLYIGRLQRKKNTQRLVEAFAVLRNRQHIDVDLVLAGKPDFGFSEISAVIKKNDISDSVHVLGYTPTEDVSILLHGAQVFCFPSLYEGFGFPILEAQASGTPVLASTATCLPEIAGNGALLVDPMRVDAIAEGIRRLLDDAQLRASLKEHGRKNLERFQWKDCAAATLDVLLDR